MLLGGNDRRQHGLRDSLGEFGSMIKVREPVTPNVTRRPSVTEAVTRCAACGQIVTRKHKSVAEKQRAYRQRLKASNHA